MKGRPTKRGAFALAATLLCLGIAPGAWAAQTRTYLRTTDLLPSGGAGDFGPANHFPSKITVGGLRGKVTRVTVTIIGYRSAGPDDTDLVLAKQGGPRVMLMSDACGTDPLQNDNFTFSDSAPTFLPNGGSCGSYRSTSFRPSNYLGEAPEPDDLSLSGGPPPPYLNSLSKFNGASPNGTWKLFAFDDSASAGVGFDIAAWALTVRFRPPRRR